MKFHRIFILATLFCLGILSSARVSYSDAIDNDKNKKIDEITRSLFDIKGGKKLNIIAYKKIKYSILAKKSKTNDWITIENAAQIPIKLSWEDEKIEHIILFDEYASKICRDEIYYPVFVSGFKVNGANAIETKLKSPCTKKITNDKKCPRLASIIIRAKTRDGVIYTSTKRIKLCIPINRIY